MLGVRRLPVSRQVVVGAVQRARPSKTKTMTVSVTRQAHATNTPMEVVWRVRPSWTKTAMVYAIRRVHAANMLRADVADIVEVAVATDPTGDATQYLLTHSSSVFVPATSGWCEHGHPEVAWGNSQDVAGEP